MPPPFHSPAEDTAGRFSGRIAGTLQVLLDVLLILIVAFLITFKLKEYLSVNLILIAASLLYLLRTIFLGLLRGRASRLNLIDLSLSIVVASEVFNYFNSTYRSNSIFSLAEILLLFLFYWLVRLNLTREYQRTALFIFLSLWGVFLAGFAFYSFPSLYGRLRALGFNDVTSFRNYIDIFTPVGLSIGEWCTVLFLLLPFPLILLVKYRDRRLARWMLTPASAAILLAMMLTFIRGVYIAAAVFIVVGSALFWAYGLFPLRKIAAFNLTVILLVSVGLIPVWTNVLTTLSLFSTTSQVRSFEGRRRVWKDSLRMVEEHPWLGVGAANFTKQYVAYRSQDADAAFSLRPFNYPLHILVERGVVGLLAYGLLFFSFLFVSYKKLSRLRGDVYRQAIVLLFVTAVASILMRDMSESSILINHGVGALLWFIFANVAALEDEGVSA